MEIKAVAHGPWKAPVLQFSRCKNEHPEVHRGALTQFFHLSLWWTADSDLSPLLWAAAWRQWSKPSGIPPVKAIRVWLKRWASEYTREALVRITLCSLDHLSRLWVWVSTSVGEYAGIYLQILLCAFSICLCVCFCQTVYHFKFILFCFL